MWSLGKREIFYVQDFWEDDQTISANATSTGSSRIEVYSRCGWPLYWCGVTPFSEESQLYQMSKEAWKWSAHAPAAFRVIGPLSNSEKFSKNWNCPKSSKMNRKRKCSIYGKKSLTIHCTVMPYMLLSRNTWHQARLHLWGAVSYTHLTLPTIYSV